MPKPVSITKELVDRTAFDLVRTQGMEALTARNIAQKAGCSTQPIYKIYKNLEELKASAIQAVSCYAESMIFDYEKTSIPFLNTGLGFVHFAATEKTLFRVFNIENYLNIPIFGPLNDARLYCLMEDLLGDAPLNEKERRALFVHTMIYTNGLAHLSYSGQLGMSEDELARHLYAVFYRFAGIPRESEIVL